MDTSKRWLSALVPGLENVSDKDYTDAMTLSGTKVENYKRLDKNLENIVVGEIVSIEKHPDADKLKICQVNIGTETTQIVTGATNVEVGQLVPVVLSGGKVAAAHGDPNTYEDGIKIKKGKLRGIESNGMMCGIEELGASRDQYSEAPEDGIYVFNCPGSVRDVRPGDDAVEKLGLRDTITEYEITNNRVDCYSVLGVAREAAATFNLKFVPPVIPETGNNEDVNDYIKVTVKDADLCSRYVSRAIKNIKIAPSPLWMQDRLIASGIRPINNIVDITNYVMIETGQPMHAFDYSTIRGKEIIVARANDGEVFTTLDEAERKLDKDILMINDAEGAIGIAGIMGGENSKITDDVQTVIFESATFNGTNIRKSAKRLSMRTDASGKFEKGLDPELALYAMNRACALIEELGAGEVVGGCIDVYPNPVVKKEIEFEPESYNKLLGTNVSREDMLGYLHNIEVEYDEKTNKLIIPTFRQDLNNSADIAEEVARFFGYKNIPTTIPKGSNADLEIGGISVEERIKNTAMDSLLSSGYSQIMTYSFESPKVFDKLKFLNVAAARRTIEISNPLGEDYSIMRTLPINGMLTSIATNYNRNNATAKLFEYAKVYIPTEDKDALPVELEKLTMAFYGDGDFYTLKGGIENVFESLRMTKRVTYKATSRRPFMHPGRQADIYYGDKYIGYLGQVHPDVADNYNIDTEVYIAVLDTETMYDYATFDVKYAGIANFPAVKRDLSLTVERTVPVGGIESIIIEAGGALLEDIKLFDVYEGDRIEAGLKSVAFSITLRAKDRTLSDEEINNTMDKIIAKLEESGAELRK